MERTNFHPQSNYKRALLSSADIRLLLMLVSADDDNDDDDDVPRSTDNWKMRALLAI